MKPIRTFSIIPSLPPELERLRDIANNIRWAWDPDSIALFRRLDDDLWHATRNNPVLMLGTIDQSRLEEAVADEGFLLHLERVARDLDAYMSSSSTWHAREHGAAAAPEIAYFSPEFGLTDALQIFAGGLGLLAGDHLKSASDLGVPLVGVGLLYQQGYFRQTLNDAGWQQEFYETNDFHNLPLTLQRNLDGTPLLIPSPHPGRTVYAQVWKVQVGRIALYLLDTNIDANEPRDRDITDQLYGGDRETRIRQEIVLGIGGFRVLRALGIAPAVFHMNEGHSAFLALERVRCLMQEHGLTFDEAREAASAGLVFTTHTPVIAGHDAFPSDLIERYLGEYRALLGISQAELMALGRLHPADPNELFGMTVLALRMAAYSNGVSRLHGQVSRGMWQELWPGVPVDETPIGHVTNGVHLRSWVSEELDHFYDRYIGSRWRSQPSSNGLWQQAARIPLEELWRIHERRRERLVVFARRCLQQQLRHRTVSQAEIDVANSVLDPEILTIGFARRFATYKRATLLFQDMERLERIVSNGDRPVQFIFAGKAHPRDDAGKELIRQILSLVRQPAFRHRMVFIEDYDMEIARFLVQGCDVWLNNPRRPQEASGTSGMKAAANGVLNFSTLDGWWDEAWDAAAENGTPVGWAIGRGETYEDTGYQDQIESDDIYDVLERDIVPLFYERGPDRLPREWVARMQATIERLCPFVNMHRVVRDYTNDFYLPAAAQYRALVAPDMEGTRELAAWRKRVTTHWSQVRATPLDSDDSNDLHVGAPMQTRALVRLGGLDPSDVVVQLYAGRLDSHGDIADATPSPMRLAGKDGKDACVYESEAIPWRASGLYGYTIRVLPHHPRLNSSFIPGLITWAGE
ncbi:MAG TPA: alpha-glucan family phosphorylase [Thermomicrobiales bacterium]|nr:alpha-glucan family phosphorylase [Thermomicrobiales bacterium]